VSDDIRILLLADSHLGFDLPMSPRSGRRRRGYDFLANYATALEPALRGQVDLVVHAGDVFDRPSVVPSIAYQAYEPLKRVADAGVPVFIVPGNHERSRLPHAALASHPGIHVFDRPRTCVAQVRGTAVSLSGFPYERREVRRASPSCSRRRRGEAITPRIDCSASITASKVRLLARPTSRLRPPRMWSACAMFPLISPRCFRDTFTASRY